MFLHKLPKTTFHFLFHAPASDWFFILHMGILFASRIRHEKLGWEVEKVMPAKPYFIRSPDAIFENLG